MELVTPNRSRPLAPISPLHAEEHVEFDKKQGKEKGSTSTSSSGGGGGSNISTQSINTASKQQNGFLTSVPKQGGGEGKAADGGGASRERSTRSSGRSSSSNNMNSHGNFNVNAQLPQRRLGGGAAANGKTYVVRRATAPVPSVPSCSAVDRCRFGSTSAAANGSNLTGPGARSGSTTDTTAPASGDGASAKGDHHAIDGGDPRRGGGDARNSLNNGSRAVGNRLDGALPANITSNTTQKAQTPPPARMSIPCISSTPHASSAPRVRGSSSSSSSNSNNAGNNCNGQMMSTSLPERLPVIASVRHAGEANTRLPIHGPALGWRSQQEDVTVAHPGRIPPPPRANQQVRLVAVGDAHSGSLASNSLGSISTSSSFPSPRTAASSWAAPAATWNAYASNGSSKGLTAAVVNNNSGSSGSITKGNNNNSNNNNNIKSWPANSASSAKAVNPPQLAPFFQPKTPSPASTPSRSVAPTPVPTARTSGTQGLSFGSASNSSHNNNINSNNAVMAPGQNGVRVIADSNSQQQRRTFIDDDDDLVVSMAVSKRMPLIRPLPLSQGCSCASPLLPERQQQSFSSPSTNNSPSTPQKETRPPAGSREPSAQMSTPPLSQKQSRQPAKPTAQTQPQKQQQQQLQCGRPLPTPPVKSVQQPPQQQQQRKKIVTPLPLQAETVPPPKASPPLSQQKQQQQQTHQQQQRPAPAAKSPQQPLQQQSADKRSPLILVLQSSNFDELDDKEDTSGDFVLSGSANISPRGGPLVSLPSFTQQSEKSPPRTATPAIGCGRRGKALAPITTSNTNTDKSTLRTSLVCNTANNKHSSMPLLPEDDGRPARPTAAEKATLAKYLAEEDLNLSMSTFTAVGPTLSLSRTLRVLNLRGSTISSEGLRGLGDIHSLQSICVSHMRRLTSLAPLIACSKPGDQCLIQEIDAQCTPLRDQGILGLELLPRLRKLDLSLTAISDVTCLSTSRFLKELSLGVTSVDDRGIIGLERIPTLVMLNICRTRVSSLSSLVRSMSLQTLRMYSSRVTDAGIQGIEKMPRLAHVDVSTTKVTDLSVFRNSHSLRSIKAQWLALKNCSDIIQERRALMDRLPPPDASMAWRDLEAGYAGLADIPTLELVDLSFNPIRSVHSLCKSRSIKHLVLRRTRVETAGIAGIKQLAQTLETLVVTNLTDSLGDEEDEEEEMTALIIPGCFAESSSAAASRGMLTRIDDVASLRRLTVLDLSYTDVFDLRMLASLPFLSELSIVETLVTVDGLRGIEKIPSLEVLDLSQTSVLSLQFLAEGAPALRSIIAKSNRNTRGFRLGHIEGLPSLVSLDISDTVVEDIRMMWKPTWKLQELTWRWGERREATGPVAALGCWVTAERLRGLGTMPCLRMLDIANSAVLDLDFVCGSKSMSTVVLSGCRLLRNHTLHALTECPSLESVDLCNSTRISDVSVLAKCPHLRELLLANTDVSAAGLGDVVHMSSLKVLDLTNTAAEEHIMYMSSRSGSNGMTDGGSNHIMSPMAATSTAERSAAALAGGGPGENVANSGCIRSASPQSGRHKRGGNGVIPKEEKESARLRDAGTILDVSAAPAQFRVPRRRRVNFVTSDGIQEGDGTL